MAVTNPYYEFDPVFIPGTKVRSDAANLQFQAIQNAFDLLPGTSDALTTDTAIFAPESGSGNAYVVTMPDTRTSNQDGDGILFFATHTNTGACTIAVDAIGAVALTDWDGTALTGGEIVSGRIYEVRYDATNSRFTISANTDAQVKAAYAQEWATQAEDVLVSAAAGGNQVDEYSAYHWAQKSLAGAVTGRINTDIVTATPPTSELVTGALEIYDQDDTDLLARFGFSSSSLLGIRNYMQGGPIQISSTDSGGVERIALRQNPATDTALYHVDGNPRLITTTQGVGLLGNLVDPEPPTSGAHDTHLLFMDASGTTEIGSIEYSSPGTMFIRNKVHNADMSFSIENNAGTEKQFINAQGSGDLYIDAPGGSTFIRRAGITYIELGSTFYLRASSNERVARMNAISSGGMAVMNTKTGPDTTVLGQRVLTLADWEAGQDRATYAFSAQTTATDPFAGNFKVDNADYTLVTNIYVSDESKGEFPRTTHYSSLAAGDLITIGFTKTPDTPSNALLMTTFRVTAAATDNTGWWTIPVEYVSGSTSGFVSISSTDLYILNITRASAVVAVPDGTAEGNTLYWDATGGAWTETAEVSFDVTNTALSIGDHLTIEDQGGTPGTSGITELKNGAGTVMIRFLDTDGPWVEIDDFNLKLADAGASISRKAAWWGGSRNEIKTLADGEFNFSAENATGTPRAHFDYPINIATKNASSAKPVTKDFSSMTFHPRNVSSTFNSAMFVQNGTAISWPVGQATSLHYGFSSSTTAADPGVPMVRFNTADFSTTTTLYVSDEDLTNEDQGWFFGRAAVGDVLLMSQGSDRGRWVEFEVDSITDSTGYWTIGVTALDHAGTIFVNGQDLRIDLLRSSLIPGSGAPATGTVEGSTLYWDNAGGSWIENTSVKWIAADSQMLFPEDNDQLTPTIGFGDGSYGFHGNSDDVVAVVLGGVNRFFFQGAGNYLTGSSSSSFYCNNAVSSRTVPTLGPRRDFDTGIGSAGNDEMSLICGSIEMLRLVEGTSDYLHAQVPLFMVERAAATTDIAGSGQLWVNSADSHLYFTDDGSTDYQISGGGSGFANTGFEIRSAANLDTEARLIEFTHSDSTIRAQIGYVASGVLQILNEVHGEGIILGGEDAGGVSRTFLTADPDSTTTVRGDTDVNIQVNAGVNSAVFTGGGAVTLYYNNNTKFRTADQTAAGNISGAEVYDADGGYRPVGLGVIIDDSTVFGSGTQTPFQQINAHQSIKHTNASVTTYNTYASTGTDQTDIPDGAQWEVKNDGAGALTIGSGTGVTLYWWDGAGSTPPTGNRTLARGGFCTVKKISDTRYEIVGNGLT